MSLDITASSQSPSAPPACFRTSLSPSLFEEPGVLETLGAFAFLGLPTRMRPCPVKPKRSSNGAPPADGLLLTGGLGAGGAGGAGGAWAGGVGVETGPEEGASVEGGPS